mmetsp:Transcript_11796/g.49696  ORF Transcript_11796/g.49696 Transcript_11796/m.49696 type:complete len:305 (+) Transcript_11796:1516-2430(+)
MPAVVLSAHGRRLLGARDARRGRCGVCHGRARRRHAHDYARRACRGRPGRGGRHVLRVHAGARTARLLAVPRRRSAVGQPARGPGRPSIRRRWRPFLQQLWPVRRPLGRAPRRDVLPGHLWRRRNGRRRVRRAAGPRRGSAEATISGAARRSPTWRPERGDDGHLVPQRAHRIYARGRRAPPPSGGASLGWRRYRGGARGERLAAALRSHGVVVSCDGVRVGGRHGPAVRAVGGGATRPPTRGAGRAARRSAGSDSRVRAGVGDVRRDGAAQRGGRHARSTRGEAAGRHRRAHGRRGGRAAGRV